MRLRIALVALVALVALGCAAKPAPASPNPAICHGAAMPLRIADGVLPLVSVRVAGTSGEFLLDTGTTNSTIDLAAFKVPPLGKDDRYAPFEFFIDWGTVHLTRADHRSLFAGAKGVHIAGLIGTDFLSVGAYTLDYEHARVQRASARELCADEVLLAEGLSPLSTAGYFAADVSRLFVGYPNVPTIPIRIGGVPAIAQIDTGFSDSFIRHSVNINRAYLEKLIAAGIALTRGEEVPLTTCVPGVKEITIVYRGAATFEMVGTDGAAVRSVDDATYFLKESPKEAAICGGIGTWSTPAAQLGASFYADAKRIVLDPFSSRVWLGR